MAEGSFDNRSWHFFLRLLNCLQVLVGRNWKWLVVDWSSTQGALITIQCAIDILANVFNTNVPYKLEVCKTTLFPLLKFGQIGPGLDLDSFLLALVHEFNVNVIPVDTLKFPRRFTDGSLPTISNLNGSSENENEYKISIYRS